MEGGRRARDDGRRTAGTQFACFTRTKVHILTQKALQPVTLGHWLAAAAVFVSMVNIGGGFVMTNRMLGIFGTKVLAFTGTKVPILVNIGGGFGMTNRMLGWLVHRYKYWRSYWYKSTSTDPTSSALFSY